MTSKGIAAPISASGATIRLTIGIATALASGETIETCWNIASSGGISASVTATCTFAQPASQRGQAMRPTDTYVMTAIAPNESQNPGASTAHGSSSTTANSANASTAEADPVAPSHSAAATTAS